MKLKLSPVHIHSPILGLVVLFCFPATAASQSYTLEAPDRKIELQITIGNRIAWTPRGLEFDLSFLSGGNYQMMAFQDGVNADRFGSDYQKTVGAVDKSTKLKISLAGGGGWAARIQPVH